MQAPVLCVGHAVQDFIFAIDAIPSGAEKFRASDFDSIGGGPAATAAVTVARLGGQAILAARIGDDGIGEIIHDELQHYGVDCSLLKRFAGARSSLSSVLLDARGERMIVNYLDGKLPVAPDWLPDRLPDGTGAVLGDVRWPEGTATVFGLAQAAGIPAILDADTPVPADGELLRCATHLAFSADGLRNYSGHEEHGRALREIAADTGAWCCVTLGVQGVLYTDGEELKRMPAFSVSAIDTLAAGDVWHGAFAQALAETQPLRQALRFASAAAALKVQRFGGRRGVPNRAELDDFLREHSAGEV